MKNFDDELNILVSDIMDGLYTKQQVHEELKRIEAEYPEDNFTYFIPTRKEKPWNFEYLKDLAELFYSNASSKEFIEYMAEVSEEVYRAKRLKKIALCVLIAIAAVAVVVLVIRFLTGD